ncbi:kinase C delta type-like [Pelobates cultripes]|uniref:Kinase C delta type-like n=1 Tax=Pelobates cultripes TaxID=61616 RepID=A0AAD1TFH4_PELCU|nr:kinase C delta type-like [Pelobates cultripes]
MGAVREYDRVILPIDIEHIDAACLWHCVLSGEECGRHLGPDHRSTEAIEEPLESPSHKRSLIPLPLQCYYPYPYSVNTPTPAHIVLHSPIPAHTVLIPQPQHTMCINTVCAGVMLATHLPTKKLLAVKIIQKRPLLHYDSNRILRERRVLEVAAGNIFLNHLYATFQTKLPCWVAVYNECGSSLWILSLCSIHTLTHNRILFFAAQLVCGLQFLHANGIIHRDLKPENIIMDRAGHLKICDFGLALDKMCGKTATGEAGTPGYIAPEMKNGERYNAAVDWWAFGVILFKMATGMSAFDRNNRLTPTGQLLLTKSSCHHNFISNETWDILKQLLCMSPAERLGVNGDIRSHPFFRSIDWVELEAGRLGPPSLPAPLLDCPLPSGTQVQQFGQNIKLKNSSLN